MRQRLDLRGVQRHVRVEQVRQPDAQRLGHQPELGGVAVKAGTLVRHDHLAPLKVSGVQELLAVGPARVFEHDAEDLWRDLRDADDLHHLLRDHPAEE